MVPVNEVDLANTHMIAAAVFSIGILPVSSESSPSFYPLLLDIFHSLRFSVFDVM